MAARFACIALGLLLLAAGSLASGVSFTTASGISVGVNASHYEVSYRPYRWRFSADASVHRASVSIGRDRIGAYRQLSFALGQNHAAIRAYEQRPAVLFRLLYPKPATGS